MHTTTFSKKPPLLIVLLLVSYASVGAVLFTPALPAIASFFNLSVGETQSTITAYLFGYALGQLPYGPLANRFGRKKTLYMGVALSIVGSLLCALAAPLHSFNLLVFARFVQALGACVGLKMSFTMIADVYNQTQATKVISKVLIAFAIMPGIAVAIGGWLTESFSWESCFYFLIFFGFFILALLTFLPETSTSLDPEALNPSAIIHGYGLKFKNIRLVLSGCVMGCSTAVIYIFASKAPFIGIDLLGLSPERFGQYNLIPLVGLVMGSLISMRIAGRYSVIMILFVGIVGALIATFTMLIPFFLDMPKVWSLFVPMGIIYIALAHVSANISSFGLAHSKNKSNGSAVINFINLGIGFLGVLFSQLIFPESPYVMPVSFLVIFLIMLCIWIKLKRLDDSIN